MRVDYMPTTAKGNPSATDVATRLDFLFHAPVQGTKKPRVSFATKQEARDFERGFKLAVAGHAAPAHLPESHGIAQKYQDALANGWSHGRIFSVEFIRSIMSD